MTGEAVRLVECTLWLLTEAKGMSGLSSWIWPYLWLGLGKRDSRRKKHFVFSKDVQINFTVNNQTGTTCLKSLMILEDCATPGSKETKKQPGPVTQHLLICAPTYLIMSRRQHIHKKSLFLCALHNCICWFLHLLWCLIKYNTGHGL